jgi:hypothetical protein
MNGLQPTCYSINIHKPILGIQILGWKNQAARLRASLLESRLAKLAQGPAQQAEPLVFGPSGVRKTSRSCDDHLIWWDDFCVGEHQPA